MHTRVVTLTGAKDIDAGVSFVRDKVMPTLQDQRGYRGLTISADRANGVFAVLSLWDSAEDRDATDTSMASSRQEAADIIGGDLKVETFEQMAADVGDTPPGPGSALIVTRVSMDPDKVDDNVAFFKSSVMPRMKALPGFQGLRNMLNRGTGEGVVGTVWADDASRREAADVAMANRDEAIARGVEFGEMSFREILLADMR